MQEKWTIYLRTSITWDMIEGKTPIPYQPLAVIKEDPNVFDHIQVGEQRYTVGIVSHKERRAYVQPITLGGEHDTEYTDKAVCPHCGHEHVDCWEWGADEDEQNCSRCSLPFTYYREVKVEYTTVKKGPSRKKLLVQV